jgi:hypothetical protein
MPSTIQLLLTYNSPPVPVQFNWSRLNCNTNATTTGTAATTTLTDTTATLGGIPYNYYITAVPVDPNNLVNGYHYTASNSFFYGITPIVYNATDNQTVDARYDPRYSTYTYLDHNFGTSHYRGGLFIGVAPQGDNSRIGRSFLRFTNLPAPPDSNSCLLIADLNVYFVGASTTNTTGWTVGVQPVTDNGWTINNLTWDSAPSFDPTKPQVTTTLTYDTASPQPGFVAMNVLTSFELAMDVTGGTYSLGLADVNEPSDLSGGVTSWLYFARKEVGPTYTPCIVYAYGGAFLLLSVVLDSSTVKGGTPITGTVYLNGVPDLTVYPQGLALSFTSNSQFVPTGSATIQGSATGRFSVATNAVTTSQAVVLTCSAGSAGSMSVNLTLTP